MDVRLEIQMEGLVLYTTANLVKLQAHDSPISLHRPFAQVGQLPRGLETAGLSIIVTSPENDASRSLVKW